MWIYKTTQTQLFYSWDLWVISEIPDPALSLGGLLLPLNRQLLLPSFNAWNAKVGPSFFPIPLAWLFLSGHLWLHLIAIVALSLNPKVLNQPSFNKVTGLKVACPVFVWQTRWKLDAWISSFPEGEKADRSFLQFSSWSPVLFTFFS